MDQVSKQDNGGRVDSRRWNHVGMDVGQLIGVG